MTGEIKEIRVSDCPSIVDDGQVACLAIPNSDIFYKDSIVYVEEAADVAEGDSVYEDGEYIGIAYYSRGWRVHLLDGSYKPLVITSHIDMKKNEQSYESFKRVNEIEGRVGVLVYAGGWECSLWNMLMVKNNEVVFSGRNRRVYCDEIFLSTGIYTSSNTILYFGQFIQGGRLCLNEKLEFVVKSSTNETKINMEEL